jgi:hypothetical protein
MWDSEQCIQPYTAPSGSNTAPKGEVLPDVGCGTVFFQVQKRKEEGAPSGNADLNHDRKRLCNALKGFPRYPGKTQARTIAFQELVGLAETEGVLRAELNRKPSVLVDIAADNRVVRPNPWGICEANEIRGCWNHVGIDKKVPIGPQGQCLRKQL